MGSLALGEVAELVELIARAKGNEDVAGHDLRVCAWRCGDHAVGVVDCEDENAGIGADTPMPSALSFARGALMKGVQAPTAVGILMAAHPAQGTRDGRPHTREGPAWHRRQSCWLLEVDAEPTKSPLWDQTRPQSAEGQLRGSGLQAVVAGA